MRKWKKCIWIALGIGFMAVLTVIAVMIGKSFVSPSATVWKEWKPALHKGESIIDGVKEGASAYLIISRKGRRDYGDLLVVLEQKGSRWERVYENDFEELHPWKIEAADVDGDGTQELLTAVNKTAHYDPVLKNRLFVFNYENGILTKKWTGSAFTGEWIDFHVGDLLPIPGSEVIFTEQAGGKKEKLSIYYWFDFGFVKLAESDSYKDIIALTIMKENLLKVTYDKKYKRTAFLTVLDGKIVETASEE
ncbi:MAG TPA: hypothetical protein VN258_02445 [Mobilitalea sp.]|nr:hypothetical protein [Mobilitalea sp.]